MAVGQGRTTPSKRGMRRSHDKLGYMHMSTDVTSGERHIRHHLTKDGYYRGKQLIVKKAKDVDNEE